MEKPMPRYSGHQMGIGTFNEAMIFPTTPFLLVQRAIFLHQAITMVMVSSTLRSIDRQLARGMFNAQLLER